MKRKKNSRHRDHARGGRYKRYHLSYPGTYSPIAKQLPGEITVYSYTEGKSELRVLKKPEECIPFLQKTDSVNWINIGGLEEQQVNKICEIFGIHALIAEDILSIGQRPKMDDLGDKIFALMYMLYYNDEDRQVESEQLSLVLGPNFVLSFQEDPSRDVFNPVREKIQIAGSRIRTGKADYLIYSMIDLVVDNYFIIMEKLGERIEDLEEDIAQWPDTATLGKINFLRKEMMFLRRSVSPVREIVNGILRSENPLIEDRTEKYFRDIYDHIIQANELAENYRDMMINLQDLYLSNVNIKMNEVMKVMAVVTCLLAPATVIGGIFGMNFGKIPFTDSPIGFYLAVAFMLLVPIIMIWIFRRRGWF